ncbi:hypothetical protein [Clostridium frigidicarnis]|nr:hypothetical protein [Clostridium frigidicarnis]
MVNNIEELFGKISKEINNVLKQAVEANKRVIEEKDTVEEFI